MSTVEQPAPLTGSALQVVDRSSGQVTGIVDAARLLQAAGIADITAATDEELARLHVDIKHAHGVFRETTGIVDAEVVDRMDRDSAWTRRIESYKFVSSSPAAGTIQYDGEILHAVVNAAVAEGVISQAAADNAVAAVPPTTSVPYPLLWQIRDALDGRLDMTDLGEVADAVAGLLEDEPASTYRQKPAGINALLKHPVMAPALRFIQLRVTPPPRKVTVTQIKPRGA
jgi:hypothetical protein